jgi:putative ABC transport system permease protein
MNALIRFLFRKMWNNRWLTLSTLAGLLIAVAFTTSIPIYADGALKRVVAESLKENSKGLPAGTHLIGYQAPGGRTDWEAFRSVDQYIAEEVPEKIGFPAEASQKSASLRPTEVVPEDPTKVDASLTRRMTMVSFSGLQEKVELAGGNWFTDHPLPDGTIQAVMMEEAMFRLDLHVGDVLLYPIYGGNNEILRVEIVGSFRPVNAADPYWYQGLDALLGYMFISETALLEDLAEKRGIPLQTVKWYTAYDLSEIQTSQLAPLSAALKRIDIEVYKRSSDTRVEISFAEMLGEFRRSSIQLQTLLFTLAAPMIAMVFYFITMNARQSLEKQRSDIAVLRSRGASTRQIFMIFLLEGAILGALSLLLGPLLGWFMAKSIGSANGFLEFVNRKAIPVGFSTDSALAGVAAVMVAIMAAVIPAMVFTRTSIVDYKRRMARTEQKPFWQKWFLDLVLAGIAAYGWYLFNERQMVSFKTGLTTDQLNVQPFLFFVPALAIFAAGLIFLRIFPLLLKLINLIWRKRMPVPFYLPITQLSRSANAYYPLMILLILTIGLGVYNASAARTIGLNAEERVKYRFGTDVVIKTVWEGRTEFAQSQNQQQPGGGGSGGSGGGGGGGGGQPNRPIPTRITYSEPPFEIFRTLPGVQHAARVLQAPANLSVSGKTAGQGIVMGFDNVDFARVAWLRKDMYSISPFTYLAWLGKVPEGAIISANLAERFDLQRGDTVQAVINGEVIDFVIIGIEKYWPSEYPDQAPFLLANLDYIYDQIPMIPYDVWLKMEPDAKVAPIIPILLEKGIEIARIDDMRSELAAQSKHPSRGGVFGILSLGFFVTVIVTLAGYLLYWFYNLSSRTVQIGILRAMGLSRKQLTGMLLLEQIFTAGLSIVLGFIIGKMASLLFLPFLQTTENTVNQIPPFRVVFSPVDTMRLSIVIGIMMVIGAGLLITHIRRLRVHQAVKLGEER